MTFEQSDLQRLIEEIIELYQRYCSDPSAIDVICSELRTLYQKIPIYPGIIVDCLPKIVQPLRPEELKEGNEISVLLKNNQIFVGKVAAVASDKITLVDCKQFERPRSLGEVSLPMRDVHGIKLLMRGILQKEWPSLDFGE
ncbi:MAG: hypothetical protein QMC89_03470 [Candidatus Hodarchaeaceae archaeon]|nr:hypothetical protein [Candidatus Hodarchaeaceae archaeon]